MKNIFSKLKPLVLSFFILLNLAPIIVTAQTTPKDAISCGVNSAAGTNDCSAQPSTNLNDTVKTIINLLSIIVGIVAVIMIIIAGLRYITSGGDADSIKGAKNTLLYAIIGLVIAALAQIIVHFVLNQTTKGTT